MIDKGTLEQIRERRFLANTSGRAIREEAGLSQEAAARLLGVHRVSLSRWERGARRPRGAARTAYVALLRELLGETVG